MKMLGSIIAVLTALSLAIVLSVFAQEHRRFSFEGDASGQDPKAFASLVGTWRLEKDGARQVYAVDGRTWRSGTLSSAAEDKAKALYGDNYAQFLKGLKMYGAFPLGICREIADFEEGTLTVSFKALEGKEDQAAGIAFNIRENGEYLAIRANALEDNLVLFKFENGKRSSLKWADNAPTPSKQWHALKVVVKGRHIEGYLDDRKYIDYTHGESISGRIGLWSKADSHVFFDNFMVQQ